MSSGKQGLDILSPNFQAARGTLTRRGRPKLESPRHQVTLRLDQEVVDGFRETGPGWQERINERRTQFGSDTLPESED